MRKMSDADSLYQLLGTGLDQCLQADDRQGGTATH